MDQHSADMDADMDMAVGFQTKDRRPPAAACLKGAGRGSLARGEHRLTLRIAAAIGPRI